MVNILEVADAWIRAARPTPGEKERAQERLDICHGCPHFKSILDITYCGECLCPIEKKIFSANSESCPNKRWKR